MQTGCGSKRLRAVDALTPAMGNVRAGSGHGTAGACANSAATRGPSIQAFATRTLTSRSNNGQRIPTFLPRNSSQKRRPRRQRNGKTKTRPRRRPSRLGEGLVFRKVVVGAGASAPPTRRSLCKLPRLDKQAQRHIGFDQRPQGRRDPLNARGPCLKLNPRRNRGSEAAGASPHKHGRGRRQGNRVGGKRKALSLNPRTVCDTQSLAC